MSEQRTWEVGDWLVRRRDGLRGIVAATRARVLFTNRTGCVVVGLDDDYIAAKQPALEADGWELREGLEQ